MEGGHRKGKEGSPGPDGYLGRRKELSDGSNDKILHRLNSKGEERKKKKETVYEGLKLKTVSSLFLKGESRN